MKLLIVDDEDKVIDTINDLDSLNLIEPMAQINLCMRITTTINSHRTKPTLVMPVFTGPFGQSLPKGIA